MKNNLEHYQHYVSSHNHWKFKVLRREYQNAFNTDGWAGEGKFWALNNLIAESDGCRLDLVDENKRMSISVDLNLDIVDFDKFLLIVEKKAKLIFRNPDGSISTGITQENLVHVSKRRQSQREWVKNRRENQTSENDNSTPDSKSLSSTNSKSSVDKQQSKVKESKVYIGLDKSNPVGVGQKTENSTGKDGKQKAEKGKTGAAPPKKEPNPETELFHKFKNLYAAWYKTREGQPPKLDGGGYAAVKSLVGYFRAVAKDEFHGQEFTDEQIDSRAFDWMSRVLVHDWDKMQDDFLKRTDIKNINSQINNILSHQKQISDGTYKKSFSGNGQKLGTSDARELAARNYGLANTIKPSPGTK